MIKYIKGDATEPQDKNPLLIHICNDIGAWGKGFVLAISRKWKEPELQYKAWFDRSLGKVQYIPLGNIIVANMIAQRGLYTKNDIPPIRYDALEKCLEDVAIYARLHSCTIHMPKIGAGLAGGDWNKIESIIKDKLNNYKIYVYELD